MSGTGAGRIVRVEPLTAAAFAPFGEVVEASGAGLPINGGAALRYSDLVKIEALAGGRPTVAIARVLQSTGLPLAVTTLERHPLGSQAFIPLNGARMLVVVARDEGAGLEAGVRAFLGDGRQGVNYRAGAWHHALAALAADDTFLVIDRAGEGVNVELVTVAGITVAA